MTAPPRRGRPRAGEQAARRQAALDAALAELLANGVEGMTMQAVAARAGSSKESLYTWFGNRHGLLAALIEWQAEQTNTVVTAALGSPADPRATLLAIADGLLRLLVGDVSVALNRAAMSTIWSSVEAPALPRATSESASPRISSPDRPRMLFNCPSAVAA